LLSRICYYKLKEKNKKKEKQYSKLKEKKRNNDLAICQVMTTWQNG